MTTGTGKSDPRPFRNSTRAVGPPVEAPTTMHSRLAPLVCERLLFGRAGTGRYVGTACAFARDAMRSFRSSKNARKLAGSPAGLGTMSAAPASKARKAGLELPFSCRAGVCSTCRTKVVRGEVQMAQNYALEEWEVEQGYVLACQSRVTTPVLELDYDEK